MKTLSNVVLVMLTLGLSTHGALAAGNLEKCLYGHGNSQELAEGDFLGKAKSFCTQQGYATYFPMGGQYNWRNGQFYGCVTCAQSSAVSGPAKGLEKCLAGNGVSQDLAEGDFLGNARAFCKKQGYSSFYSMGGQYNWQDGQFYGCVTCTK